LGEFNVSDIVGIASIAVAIISLLVAISALNFSKRSYLLKETYDPLLESLKVINKVKFTNTEKVNVLFIESLRGTYHYLAFSYEERKLFDLIIKSAKEINTYKLEAHRVAEKSLLHAINDSDKIIEKENDVLELELVGKPSEDFYTLIAGRWFAHQILFGTCIIECVIGEVYEEHREDTDEYIEVEKRLYKTDLRSYIERILDVPQIDDEFSKCEVYLDSIEKEVYEDFIDRSRFNQYEKEYYKLLQNVSQLHYLIEEKIKRMLIPNYVWKKYW
jgi:hypothetical protein